MPTSELSDALNPYYAQLRSGQRQPQPPRQPPHRSELELAISPPSVAPRAAGACVSSTLDSAHHSNAPARSTNPHGGGVHAVQELLRFLAQTREAQEIEHKRRIAWEQEQEARYRLRQAEMERRMLEMQQEITALKARVAFSSPASSSSIEPSVNAPCNPAPSQRSQLDDTSPAFLSRQPTPATSPTLSHTSTSATLFSPAVGQPVAGPSTDPVFGSAEMSTSSSYLPSPSMLPTRFVNVDPSSSLGNVRRRYTAGLDTEDEPDSDEDSPPQHRVRRKNHHDTRCLTIQHAMRIHLLRTMMLETDKHLPDSHAESTLLGSDEPVRFVWDKTPRQSVHNARMKERVLKDLKANRTLYKHVSDKDFGKKILDAVFDQAFVTLRQKFKAQRDESAAQAHKQREDLKAQRARRLSRRKIKLGNRSDARNKITEFEHVTFDGALQIECMSSEESEVEEDAATGTRTTLFRIRGFAWRSVRLQRFFDTLDEGDKADNTQRPRRGVGRKERIPGPPKEGVAIPPKGVAIWMISKRWVRLMEGSHGEVVRMLKGIVTDGAGIDVLGEGSEEEGSARHFVSTA